MWPAERSAVSAGSHAGDIDELFRKEYRGMLRLAFGFLGDNARAEEVVQDAFVDVLRSADEVRRPGAFLRTAVVNRCRSELRRRRVRELHPPPRPDDLSVEAEELWDVLNKLTEDERIAIVLKYHGRFRSSEIAKIMDIAPSTVRYHVREGLASLRKELEP